MDKPLSVWYCDVCDERMETKSALAIWRSERLICSDFKIIHVKKCDKFSDSHNASMHLLDLLGVDGLVKLSSFFTSGLALSNESLEPISDMAEFIDFLRRCQIPYYEEARRYFKSNETEDFLQGSNEIFPYIETSLQEIIRINQG